MAGPELIALNGRAWMRCRKTLQELEARLDNSPQAASDVVADLLGEAAALLYTVDLVLETGGTPAEPGAAYAVVDRFKTALRRLGWVQVTRRAPGDGETLQ